MAKMAYSPANLTIILLFAFLFSIIFVYRSFSTSNRFPQSLSDQTNWVDYKLSEAASMVAHNNTLIVCTVSEPFLPLMENWLISVSKQNHQNMVLVIAEDYPTLFHVNKRWPGHAVMLSPPIINSKVAKDFGSKEYYMFTSRRPHYLLTILELGYNVMYNDVDMVWLADPFPYMVGQHDVYIIDDDSQAKSSPWKDSHYLRKDMYICGGMMYMRPTNGSKLLMKKWIEEIKAQPWIKGKYINDQPAFNKALVKTMQQVNTYLLPQTSFPSGGLYFGNAKWVKETNGRHVLIHNNWIIGLEKKIGRFKKYGLWMIDDHSSEDALTI